MRLFWIDLVMSNGARLTGVLNARTAGQARAFVLATMQARGCLSLDIFSL